MLQATCAPLLMAEPAVFRWIKTDCGRAKYTDLAARRGPGARLRLAWFVVIAALRDWRLSQLTTPEQQSLNSQTPQRRDSNQT